MLHTVLEEQPQAFIFSTTSLVDFEMRDFSF